MACNKCNKNEDCGCKATSVTINSICNPIDCGTEECSESFPAQCILYTGDDIICDESIIVTSGDSVAQSLANIVQYFCSQTIVSADIVCGEQTIVLEGSTVNEALNFIVLYFCQLIDGISIASISSEQENIVVDNCTTTTTTLSFWSDLGQTQLISSVPFTFTYCDGIDGVDGNYVTQLALPEGNINCPYGGTEIRVIDAVTLVVLSTTYVCSAPQNAIYGKYAQTNASLPVADPNAGTLVGVGQGDLIFTANSLAVGESYRGRMSGILTSTNTQELSLLFKLNGVTVATSGLINMLTASIQRWSLEFDFTVKNLGVGGEIILSVSFSYLPNTAPALRSHTFNAPITIDTTILNTLDVEASYNLNEAGANTIQSQFFVLNKTF